MFFVYLLSDNEQPSVTCPSNLALTLSGPSYESNFTLSDVAPASASDNSGKVSLIYDPPELYLTAADHQEVFLVHVTAIDDMGNVANCSYYVMPEG